MPASPVPMLLLLLLLLLGLSSAGPPVIRLRDPGGGAALLEGSNVTLECLSEEEEEEEGGGPGLAFQKYQQHLRAWLPLEAAPGLPPAWPRVALPAPSVRQEAGGRLLLSIGGAQPGHDGAYRCLATAAHGSPAAASAQFDLRVEYLRRVFVFRVGTWCGTVGDSESIREGQDVKLSCLAEASQEPLYEWSREGQDWTVASRSLVLRRFGRSHAGTYTCRARHPSLAQLQASRSLRLDVVSKGVPEWAAVHGLALAVAVPTSLLLLVLAAFSLLIITRHRAAAKAKAPREEGLGQRSPIYKGSPESMPSTTGDTQPLVM